jgi:hypothetical protein
MNPDRELDVIALRRERGRRLAWIAAGVAIVVMLMLLGPSPSSTSNHSLPDAGMRLLEPSAPAVPPHVASLSSHIDWDAKEPSADPSPLSVAAYDR